MVRALAGGRAAAETQLRNVMVSQTYGTVFTRTFAKRFRTVLLE